MSEKLRIGIIGTGNISHLHIQSYKGFNDCEIVALCDLVPGKAEKFKTKYKLENANCYTDYKEMVDKEQLDAVSVCTYNTTHTECTVYALNHGVNVLIEKPMCVTLEEGIEIMRAEKASGKIVSIGFQPRYAPMTKMLYNVVRSGQLGDVYYVQTGGGRRRGIPDGTFIEKKTGGIGAIGDIGCYALDLVLYPLGYPKPLTVSAYKSDFFGKSYEYSEPENASRFDVDDFAAAFIRFEGGLVIDFRIAWAMHMDTSGDTLMYGKKGGIRIPSTECWNRGPGGAMTIYHDVDGMLVETKLPEEPSDETMFAQKVRAFVDAIITGGKAPIPTSEIIINQAILDGIVRSAELGREIEINIPEV